MGWLFHNSYFGPDRRSGRRFEIRFLERRKRAPSEAGSRASLRGRLRELFARGLRWVDTLSYFGPDRRSDQFSHFILERRKDDAAGPPPPLHVALRQLRMRVLEAETSEGRKALRDRLIATGLLADAQGRTAIGDLLTRLAERMDAAGEADVSAMLQEDLLTAEAMLGDLAA